MGFVLELFFDQNTDAQVRALWDDLARLGLAESPAQHGARPHISIASAPELNVSRVYNELQSLAERTQAFPISFLSISVFLSPENVVFLAPVVTADLLQLQSQLFDMMQDADAAIPTLYAPGQWVPHCTLAANLSPESLAQALAHCQQHAPIEGRITEIGIVEYSATGLIACHSVVLKTV